MTNKKAIEILKGLISPETQALEERPTVCGTNPKWCESCVSKGKCASTRPKGEWLASDIRWTDKLSVIHNGDVIDFNGRVVGHINLENWIKEIKNDT